MSEAPARGRDPQRSGSEAEPAESSPIRRMALYAPPRSTRHSAAKRRRARLWVLAAAALAVLAAAGAAAFVLLSGDGGEEPVPDPFVGSWRGDMSQESAAGGHVTDWGAEVVLESGEERGSSEWYSLNCRGSLTLQERSEDRLVFDYTETYDPQDRCVDSSELVLTPAGDDVLEARWEAVSHDGTTMISTGMLRSSGG
ncbi:hypothetical protein [Nocardiopsis coralliicola]